LNPIEHIHNSHVYRRRVRILSEHLSALLSEGATLLDVGCGDGLLTHLVSSRRPDIEAQGIDVLLREKTHISVVQFNGDVIPYPPKSFDAVMFVDVLHHTDDPMILLREAARVARKTILIKDHTLKGILAEPTLRFMDLIGNARYNVKLPYNYWSESKWRDTFKTLRMNIVHWKSKLNLYYPPARWFFDRCLHFIAKLEFSNDPMNEVEKTGKK
jgi:ubiquinone/menaquinone biosynthesis C-methylase UbiE